MLNNLFMKRFSVSMVRHAATAGGAVLVAEGIADPATVETLAGGAVALLGVAWAALDKRS